MTDIDLVPPLGLVTWFHADEPARAGWYPQIRGSSASTSTYEVYLGCIDVCVASFRRWNPDGPCLVVLNAYGERVLSDARRRLWRRLAVEIRVVENRHLPETDLFGAWQNQFFLFDVLRAALDVGTDPLQPIVVVDSDVVVRAHLGDLGEEIARKGRVSMRIPYPPDEIANGVSRLDLAGFVRDLGGGAAFVPAYQGGEFVGGTKAALRSLSDACEEVYAWSIGRRATGERHPNEEAQMISVADPTPESAITGNAWIERVWTKPWNLRDFPQAVDDIAIWHLPAEKRTGIARLRPAVVEPGSWFWHAPAGPWRSRVGRIVGVPRYGPGKLLQDVVALRGDIVAAASSRVSRLVQRAR